MLDFNQPLVDAGFALHLLKPQSKAPIESNWSQQPVNSAARLGDGYRDGNNIGVRLGEPSRVCGHYLHALDVDIRDPALTEQAMRALASFAPSHATWPTVQSGSGGASRHFYFLTDKPFRSRKLAHSAEKITDAKGKEHWAFEVELLGTGKQAVLPPSIHPSGGAYRWLQEFDFELVELGLGPVVDSEIVATWAPAALPATDVEDDDLAAVARLQPLDLSESDIRETLALLPLAEWCDDRDGWLQVGMALHHQFEGSDEGYELWAAFSERSPKFDAKDQRRVWKSFTAKPGGVRFATLIQAAEAERARSSEDSVEGAGASPRIPPGPGGDVQWGREFARRHRRRFVHVRPGRSWRRWDGSRWAPCIEGEEMEAAKGFAADVLEETTVAYARNSTDANKLRNNDARALFRTARRIESMLRMAETEPGIVVRLDAFDSDPLLIAVQNGVVCLKTGELVAPAPDQMISRQSGTTFDPGAVAPRWEEFLARVQPSEEVRAFLQRAVGYTLTGLVDEERWFFLYGTGANGKSVFANVLNALLGDFAVTVGSKLLTKSHNVGEADRLVAQLPCTRLALANETAQGDVWNDQRAKELASREPISARKLYGEPFEFMPTHKLWVRGNHLPGAHDAGDGFWRRLVPILFANQIPDSERIADLDRRIIASELSGVLNWAIAGCLDWQARGLAVPPEIERGTRQYREETDILATWLTEFTERAPTSRLAIAAAFASYRSFCQEQNVAAPSMPAFSRQMSARGLGTSGSRKQGRRISGLRLRAWEPDDLDLME
jgi:putative DNA primase/helicase